MQTPPLPRSDSSTSSGALRGLSHTARAEEWLKITGDLGDPQRVAHGVGRDVGEVDEHADPVHLPDHLDAESRQPAEHRLVGGRVGPRDVAVVGQRHVAHAEHVQHAQRRRASCRSSGRPRPRAARRSGRLPSGLDVARGPREGEVRGIPRDHLVTGVDLLQRRAHGVVAGQRGRDEHRPELRRPRRRRAAAGGRCGSGTPAAMSRRRSRSRRARSAQAGRCGRRRQAGSGAGRRRGRQWSWSPR